MNLSPALKRAYTDENITAGEAQRIAQFIAFGPVVFQTARIMIKEGILRMLGESIDGMTLSEIKEVTGLTEYAVKCLMEASLAIGMVTLNDEEEKFRLTKIGWFVLNDPSTRINIDFNHDINYRGWYYLEDSLKEGKPVGLKTLGNWSTVYEGLSSLREEERKSWLAFDHFYSDHSFPQALELVFRREVKNILDVGGNTGRWAQECAAYDKDVRITVLDLPRQIDLMKESLKDSPYNERIEGVGLNILEKNVSEKISQKFDVIWMSQFLDCFNEEQIKDILKNLSELMGENSRIYIMETFWDRQRFETSAFCLTLTSLYFTAIANGNSKMYHSDDMKRLISDAGLAIEEIYDDLGYGHSLVVCKKISD